MTETRCFFSIRLTPGLTRSQRLGPLHQVGHSSAEMLAAPRLWRLAASPIRYRAKATAAVAATTASLCKSIGRGEGDANCRQRQEEV
jgi:hypothetical protein